MKTKLLRMFNKIKNFIIATINFVSISIAFIAVGIGIWTLFGLLYIGSAKLIGEWLKLVINYMN